MCTVDEVNILLGSCVLNLSYKILTFENFHQGYETSLVNGVVPLTQVNKSEVASAGKFL